MITFKLVSIENGFTFDILRDSVRVGQIVELFPEDEFFVSMDEGDNFRAGYFETLKEALFYAQKEG